jgi:Methyltransferase domain
LNWRLKCVFFQLLEHLPGGRVVYRLAQKYVTGSHLFEVTDAYLRIHQFHVTQYRRVHPGRALEFGGGRHFLSPLLLSNAGATEVLVYDIQRLSSPTQINHTIRQLRGRVSGEWPEIGDWQDLERTYRIRYVAPGDARNTGLTGTSVNFFCSTSTLEHIPPADIRQILKECSRVAAPNAVFSHIVDYADHFHYADASISLFNFYRYSERRWRWLNPPNHFQNRLRHSDYDKIFRELHWRPIETNSGMVAPEALRSISIDPLFQRYASEDLLTTIGYFVLAAA